MLTASISHPTSFNSESLGLSSATFQILDNLIRTLSDTKRYPESAIAEHLRPSTRDHTISAISRVDNFLEAGSLDAKNIKLKIALHDLDELIGREFTAVSTESKGSAAKNHNMLKELSQGIAVSAILVAFLEADPSVNKTDKMSLGDFVTKLRKEIHGVDDNNVALEKLYKFFTNDIEIKKLSADMLSPSFKEEYERFKTSYLSIESAPREQDSLSGLVGKLIEKLDGIDFVNKTKSANGNGKDSELPDYFHEAKTQSERARELSYTTSVMNRIIEWRDLFNKVIDTVKSSLVESLGFMSRADGANYKKEDFPKELGWMNQ